ncbi:HAD-IA family hydrolase [Thalassotalea psychrophila]|uniref:HAD-IA family hydrolase n=1 Tax=Thalassotalea psychrophila TaxID=3065647 RepID=A0ABY9TQ10_9GAMM|nr:HAD-IA family hydrolase [Colwelliaceae bacterium SQ149]
MLSTAKGVLFDLDGTLLDTADDLGAALNHLLNAHGFTKVSSKEYRLVASDGVYPLLDLGFKEQLAKFDKEVLRQEFLDYYLENIATHTKLFPGIEQLLTLIEDANIPWGIVTNKPAFLTDPLLLHFEQFAKSQSNISGDTIKERKPHPAPMLLASKQLGVAAEHIWYLGDAKRDIDAGNAALMTTVAVKWGYIKPLDDCSKWQANHIISNPLDLVGISK